MVTDKKKDSIFSKLERFTIPAILVLTFTIGGVYAVQTQTINHHSEEINKLKEENKKTNSKVNEIEKVPIKYDEQIKNLGVKMDDFTSTTNENIRDLRLSIERSNELLIKTLERKR